MRNKGKHQMLNAADDKLFITQDGKVLRNIKELYEALLQMSDDVFKHHVNKDKNDFALWIKEVLGDLNLARELRWTKSLPTFLKKVEQRLKALAQL